MTEPTSPSAEIGVIVGRFQVHRLSEGHKHLINYVSSRHHKVAVLLGSTPGVLVTRRNPLDFQSRKAMIQEAYPDLTVLPLRDEPTDLGWSRSLDRVVHEAFDIGSVILYGSRDSFIPSYEGRWPTVELEDSRDASGTELRQSISHKVRTSEDFRHGVVYASYNRHPVAFPTVDVALIRLLIPGRPLQTEVAMGRKATDAPGKWRFPGGFVDPRRDKSLVAAAARELLEELGQAPGHDAFKFIGSTLIDDWRYRNEEDSIMTSLFRVMYQFGPLTAGDDLDEAKWIPIPRILDLVLPQHLPLAEMLITHLKRDV